MVTSQLFELFDTVPDAWHEICQSGDLAMAAKVLRIFQRTMADQCRCWGLIIFDDTGTAIGCAALCLFQTELITSKNKTIIRARDFLRRLWPNLGRMKVLFCGLPFPAGSTHLRVRNGASAEQVVMEIDRVMQGLAHTLGGRLMVFKELSDETKPWAEALSALGYVRGEIPPMHLFRHSFRNFTDYCNALKSRYRAQIQRSQKKLTSAGFEVLSGRGYAFFAKHFDERVYQLYLAVHERAEHALEVMTFSFFDALTAELGDEVLLTLVRRDGQVCAFTFAITHAGTHYNAYSGLDYALNHEGDLYFNLFYADMDQAFRTGAVMLHLGQTSDTFKSRLGAIPQNLWFYAKPRYQMLSRIFRFLAPAIFPKISLVESHDVFNRNG